ncbi:hypothetical protein P775_00395 [Puniceibacterium antarcticum]|uniref:Tetratricopeptide repeat protein n=1 Tax=Puniceibacterium antarcticum TaxID=1206336 RepID=A0A2G8RLR4_9RHOB|nr:hypothetical protein [Puniceibacterium antarcticum]PIL22218.1 hypothetical protein P775_00395 [Puniceibacterium antarcticum]
MKHRVEHFLSGESQMVKVVRKEGSKRALFAFSHVGYPAGKFALSHDLAGIDANVIFLNAPENSWYQCGIGDDAPSIDHLSCHLMEIADTLGVSESYTVGMSMGGYAAVLFGGLLNVDAVLAFTPEITLGLYHSRSWRLNYVRIYDEKYKTVRDILNKDSKTVFNLIYGTYDLTDLALLWPIAEKINTTSNVNFLPCADAHKVPLSFSTRKLVESMMDHPRLESTELDPVSAPDERFDEPLLLALRDAAHLQETGQHDKFCTQLEESAPDRPWRNHFLAESLRLDGKHADAVAFYYRAIAQDGKFYASYFGLCESLESLGHHQQASLVWGVLLRMRPNEIQFLRRSALNLLRLNIKDGAKSRLERLIALKQDDLPAKELLAKL